MQDCDTLLMVGSSFPYSEFLPEVGHARGVQIDLDPTMIGIRYPMEVNLVGDAATTLRRLLPLLDEQVDRSWQETIQGKVRRWWKIVDARARTPAVPLNPQLVVRELSNQLPDDAIITCDTGTATVWYARDLPLRQGMRGVVSGTLATMGSAISLCTGSQARVPGSAGDRHCR